jgi:ATP-dependent DNA ligase
MPRAVSARQRSSSRFIARVLPGAKPAPFPAFIEPSLATLRSKVPAGARFVYELKFDGYRIQARSVCCRGRADPPGRVSPPSMGVIGEVI